MTAPPSATVSPRWFVTGGPQLYGPLVVAFLGHGHRDRDGVADLNRSGET
jgi:hypothetical protein